jgi:hypothetical protein
MKLQSSKEPRVNREFLRASDLDLREVWMRRIHQMIVLVGHDRTGDAFSFIHSAQEDRLDAHGPVPVKWAPSKAELLLTPKPASPGLPVSPTVHPVMTAAGPWYHRQLRRPH